MNITLRHAKPHECDALYALIHADMTWKTLDAPYFPYEQPTLVTFRNGYFNKLCEQHNRRVIDVDGIIVGTVSFYWENEATRWLEVGIAIYNPEHWGKGIGKIALQQWISEVFNMQNVARVGLTTWSGNAGMMRLAEKLGMTQEARLRKVRYHDGEYFDSIKYGVLREEWIALKEN